MRWYEQPGLHFAVGLEDTFIPQTRFGQRSLDEYELTQHYHYWHEDLALARDSGAKMIRWGIPWYRVNPAHGQWDWTWLDHVVTRFVELGLEPIVDLMHYGTPLWLANEFINDGYPEAVAEYAGRVAERYRGALNVFTPLNEPLLNTIYCGEFGYWPPYLRGDDGFVKVLRAIGRGIVLTQRAVAEASAGDATFVHVEASFRYSGDLDSYRDEVAHLRHRAFIVEDLVTGRVGATHPLSAFLARHGFADDDLAWFQVNTAEPDVMGVNYYPAVSTEQFAAGQQHTGGPLDPRPRVDAWTDGLTEVLTAFAERYQRPVFLTETSYSGSVEDRLRWLDDSVACLHRLRASGVDVVGYTWWSLLDMVRWDYRDGLLPPEAYMLPMGLCDLQPDGAGVLRRVPNKVLDRFRYHAAAAVPTGEQPDSGPLTGVPGNPG